MFETLKRLFDSGKINHDRLVKAVSLGWITQEQADEIGGKIDG